MSPPLLPFPGTLLTLLALLAALAGARADFAPPAVRSFESILTESKGVLDGGDARSCSQRQPRPTWAAFTDGKIIKRNSKHSSQAHLFSSYADDIRIFCSFNDASKLIIRDDDHQLQADYFNSTTIKVSLIRPDVGKYRYHCTDSITTTSLIVYVVPVMSVTAPNVRQSQVDFEVPDYFVPRGESYNVYCLGQQTSNLRVSCYSHDIETKSVNATTLMAIVSDHTEGEREYYCTSSSYLDAGVRITVDYYPEARDILCVLYAFIKLECWWKSTTSRNTFNLLLTYDQRSTVVCRDRSHALTVGCAGVLDDNWRSYITNDGFISIQLKSCNNVFCSNQTFSISVLSITKPNPVDDLKVVKTSPQGATVAWRTYYQDVSITHYKVEYRLLGTDWRAVNASTTYSVSDDRVFDFKFELQLALPCPDMHYELRVFVRYNEATLDVHWSEPATLFFFTAPSTGGEVDPACGAEFREVTEEPPPSATVVLYRVKQLISDERKEERALKKKISGLKKKLAQIKALMDAQK